MSLYRIVTVGKDSELEQLARHVGREVFAADDLSEAKDITKTISPSMVLFDHRLGPVQIRKFMDSIGKNSDLHVVVVGTEKNHLYPPVDFLEMGAHHYLHGKQEHHLLKQIANQIKNKLGTVTSVKSDDDFFADDVAASVSMAGRSDAILKTLKTIKLIAHSECNPVLIVGETGTGKEVAARAVHALRHPDEPFVAINCAALTANLLESELFGHVKGSFTSAEREKTGFLEFAGEGTVFLDEISEMPMDMQAKLLRVLQEKTFRKVGGTKEIICKATIIASSNCNLKAEVQAKRFRQDLYYRLDICPIVIAPLSSPERRKDIPLLAEYFLKRSVICPQKANKICSITNLAIEALQKHDWPGNVRELHNVIERAILLETTKKIGLSSIVIDSMETDKFSAYTATDNINDFSLEKAERELIARALKETNWQKTKTAQLLGISRTTLYAKVKQHNIEDSSCGYSGYSESLEEIHNEHTLPSQPEPLAVL